MTLFDPRAFSRPEDGRIVLWNEGTRRLYGYRPAEIIGRPWTVLHTDHDVLAVSP